MYRYMSAHDVSLYKDRPGGPITLSQSSVGVCIDCGFMYYLRYIYRAIEPRTDYPRLCGGLSHRFICSLYKKAKHQSRFYYQNLDKAIGAWFYYWQKELRINENKLIHVDQVKSKIFGGVGAQCITNYWVLNYDRPNPLALEKRFTIPWANGFKFTGIVDQIRETNIENISKIRPEIVKDGVLDNKYDPIVLVDLKTGYLDYEVNPLSSEEEKIKQQYELINNLQAAAYTFLYQKYNHGKLPICFSIYHLRTNKIFNFVAESETQQQLFRNNVDHVIENIKNKSFPQNKGSHCKWCDYLVECSKYFGYTISVPGVTVEATNQPVEVKVKDEYRQLKFNFKSVKPR